MQYKDEEILQNEKDESVDLVHDIELMILDTQLKESIYDDCIHVDEQKISFANREFEDLGISIYLPTTFEKMDEETKKAFYPFGNIPQYVMADMKVPFQITLNKTNHKVPDEAMETFIDMTCTLLKNNGPSATVLAKDIIRQKDHNVGIIEVVTRAIDSNVHNVLFNISIDGSILLGNFHFMTKYAKRLTVVAKEVISSIEFLEKN